MRQEIQKLLYEFCICAVQVQRIQNRKLYQHFCSSKQQMRERWAHEPSLELEQDLYHGTKYTDPELIYTDEYGNAQITRSTHIRRMPRNAFRSSCLLCTCHLSPFQIGIHEPVVQLDAALSLSPASSR